MKIIEGKHFSCMNSILSAEKKYIEIISSMKMRLNKDKNFGQLISFLNDRIYPPLQTFHGTHYYYVLPKIYINIFCGNILNKYKKIKF